MSALVFESAYPALCREGVAFLRTPSARVTCQQPITFAGEVLVPPGAALSAVGEK